MAAERAGGPRATTRAGASSSTTCTPRSRVAACTLKRDLATLREEGIVRMVGERKAAAYLVPARDEPSRTDGAA